MYAKPDPKKLAALKARAEAELARAQQIDAAYKEHRTGQERFLKAQARAIDTDAHRLGIDLSRRAA